MIRNKVVAFFFLISLCFSGCKQQSTESKTLTEFSRSDSSSFRGLYFYTTTIRMLAKVFGSESGTALSEVKGARVYFSLKDDDPQMIKSLFASLQAGVRDEGYEVLVEMKSPGSNIHVYLNDGDIPDYIFFIRGDAGDLIAELNGNLSQESIREIMQMDLSEAAEMFDLIPDKPNQGSDSLKIESPEPADKP